MPLSPEGGLELGWASLGEDEDTISLLLEYEVFLKKQRRFGLLLLPKKMRGLEEKWRFEAWIDGG